MQRAAVLVAAFADPALRVSVAAAFRIALAEQLQGVDVSAIQIVALEQSGRRLRALQQASGVVVVYEILTVAGSGSALADALIGMMTDSVSATLTTGLRDIGEEFALVEVVEMEPPQRPEILRVVVQVQSAAAPAKEDNYLLAIVLGAGVVAIVIVAVAVFGPCRKRGGISTPLITDAALESREVGSTSKVVETAAKVEFLVDGECAAGGSYVDHPAVSASCPVVADFLSSHQVDPVETLQDPEISDVPRDDGSRSVIASPPLGDAGDVPYEDDEMLV